MLDGLATPRLGFARGRPSRVPAGASGHRLGAAAIEAWPGWQWSPSCAARASAQRGPAWPCAAGSRASATASAPCAAGIGIVTAVLKGIRLGFASGDTIPATGKPVRLRMCDAATVSGGRITSHRFYYAQMALLGARSLLEQQPA